MALVFPKHTIETAGGALTVRGFNTQDIFSVMQRFHQEILAVVISGTQEQNIEAAMVRFIMEYPKLSAYVIALGSDEIDAADAIEKYPFGVQFQALTKILELTFASEGGFANFMATVSRLAALLPKQQAPKINSENGSPPSTGNAPS